MLRAIIRAFASLRLTVALLALAMLLIFVGTLAQVRVGVWEAVNTYFRSPIAWVDPGLFLPRIEVASRFRVPLPGGALVGLLLLLNLLAAHAARFRLTARRLPIIAIHAGLVVLLVSEFMTARLADEGMMSIDEGGTSSYVEDVRSSEMAFIDASDPSFDRVITIPEQMLLRAASTQRPIIDPGLPVEVHVLEWIPNALLKRSIGGGPADRGVGLEAQAESVAVARGVDGAQPDAPAAYVRLVHNGRAIGTWLVWANLVLPQEVEVGGESLGLSLRYRRTHKPYTLTLIDFRHDTFVGTEIARNFSSHVRLVDAERGVDREVTIWMNNPLRYRGDTLYQASYKPDGSGTVLQVVRNPGAALPYVACVLVGLGLAWHFAARLSGFLRRVSPNERRSADAARAGPGRWLVLAGALAGVTISVQGIFRSPDFGAFDLDSFARIPVSSGGRVKPADTAARHALMVAGGRQSVRTETGTIEAIEYLVGLIARPEAVSGLPVVRVDHPEVLAMLGRGPDEVGRVSMDHVERHWPAIAGEAEGAFEAEPKRRDPYQRAVVRFHNAVNTLLMHARLQQPYTAAPLGEQAEWMSFHDAFLATRTAILDGELAEQEAIQRTPPSVAYWIAMMTAYAESDPEGFNRAVSSYRDLLVREMPDTMRRMDLEVIFNRARVFAGATAAYLCAAIAICLTMLARAWGSEAQSRRAILAERTRAVAIGMLWGAIVVHTLGIAARVYFQGRPPVTNLYSSAIFVGWAAALFGMVMERWHPIGVAALGSSVIGMATLIVAHNMGSGGDTMQMMQAVLDSNFWLATHVITITLGYSATFLAGVLGAGAILAGVLTRSLSPQRADAIARMVYGAVCFALLLSFVGTVLGGIWADQSWGRFWGWDPKENGAALVVLNAAVILHARWGGMIRRRGLLVLAVGGNIVTAWSWFGTNMLGVGLHSYGFMDAAAIWLLAFMVSQFLIMGMGLLPLSCGRSPGAIESPARAGPTPGVSGPDEPI